jgi:hypothetical protein
LNERPNDLELIGRGRSPPCPLPTLSIQQSHQTRPASPVRSSEMLGSAGSLLLICLTLLPTAYARHTYESGHAVEVGLVVATEAAAEFWLFNLHDVHVHDDEEQNSDNEQ